MHTLIPQRKYFFLNCHDQLENYTEKVGGSNFTFVGLDTSIYQEVLWHYRERRLTSFVDCCL